MKRTEYPRRAAAIVWLEPLPPGPSMKLAPRIVWPHTGMLGVRNVMSAAKMPMTMRCFTLFLHLLPHKLAANARIEIERSSRGLELSESGAPIFIDMSFHWSVRSGKSNLNRFKRIFSFAGGIQLNAQKPCVRHSRCMSDEHRDSGASTAGEDHY